MGDAETGDVDVDYRTTLLRRVLDPDAGRDMNHCLAQIYGALHVPTAPIAPARGWALVADRLRPGLEDGEIAERR